MVFFFGLGLLGHAGFGLLGVGVGVGLIGLRHLSFLPLILFLCLVVASCLVLSGLFCLVLFLVLFLCSLAYVLWSGLWSMILV